VKLQVVVLPEGSIAVKVIVNEPVPETDAPAAGDCVNEATEQLSDTVAKLV